MYENKKAKRIYAVIGEVHWSMKRKKKIEKLVTFVFQNVAL